jgi:hypothetical protein
LLEFAKRFVTQVNDDRTSDLAVALAKPPILAAIGHAIETDQTTATYSFDHVRRAAADAQGDYANTFFAVLCKIRRSFPDVTFETTSQPYTVSMQWTNPGA